MLIFPFEPLIIALPFSQQGMVDGEGAQSFVQVNDMPTDYNWVRWLMFTTMPTYKPCYAKKSVDGKTIKWYSNERADYQANVSGYIYHYAAIGGYDMGGATEWIITSSGTWIVPRTGRYMIELYGHGGNGYYKSSDDMASGGASCQSYDSVNLTKGTVIPVSVSISSTSGSNGTSFGNYSVANGGNAVWVNSQTYHAGEGAGNKGATGVATNIGGNVSYTYRTGSLSETYGYGGSPNKQGGPRAVHIKYLGV